jgi:hypothetical protein
MFHPKGNYLKLFADELIEALKQLILLFTVIPPTSRPAKGLSTDQEICNCFLRALTYALLTLRKLNDPREDALYTLLQSRG